MRRLALALAVITLLAAAPLALTNSEKQYVEDRITARLAPVLARISSLEAKVAALEAPTPTPAPNPCTATTAGFTVAAVHAARDAAGVGGTLCFAPGTYTGELQANVVGQKWLGSGARLTSTSTCLVVVAPSVTVDGFEIDACAAWGVYAWGADDLKVLRTRIHDTAGAAIFVEGGTDRALIDGNTITRTTGPQSGGIIVHGQPGLASQGSRITNNSVSGTGQIAIEVWGNSPDSYIADNTTVGGMMGISVDASHRTVVERNTVTADPSRAWTGIEIVLSNDVLARDNTVDGAGGPSSGVYIIGGSARADVRANTIRNTSTGIGTSWGSQNINPTDGRIQANRIEGYTWVGIWLQGAERFIVTDNIISGGASANCIVRERDAGTTVSGNTCPTPTLAATPTPCVTVNGSDAAAVQTARDSGASVICFPAGHYVGEVPASVAGQTWSLDPNAVLTWRVWVQADNVTIRGGRIERGATDPYSHNVTILGGSRVTIEDVVIVGAGMVSVHSDLNTIRRNTLGAGCPSIMLWGGSDGTDDNLIEGNHIECGSIGSRGSEGPPYPVYNRRNIVRNNVVADSGWMAIEFVRSRDTVIEGNALTGHHVAGGGGTVVSLPDSDGSIVRNNTLRTLSGDWGVEIAASNDVTVENNAIFGTVHMPGVAAINHNSGSLRSLIRNNRVYDFSAFVDLGSQGTVTDNCLTNVPVLYRYDDGTNTLARNGAC